MYRLASTQCINLLVQDDTSFVYHANIAPTEGAMSVIVRICPIMSEFVRFFRKSIENIDYKFYYYNKILKIDLECFFEIWTDWLIDWLHTPLGVI